jgi:hypothetical protein
VGLTSKTGLSGYKDIVAPPTKTTFSFKVSNAFATTLNSYNVYVMAHLKLFSNSFIANLTSLTFPTRITSTKASNL